MVVKLTDQELAVLRELEDIPGADIYDYNKAVALRGIERRLPGLIEIGSAMKAPRDGAKRQPYFGVCLTDAGRQEIART